MSANFFTSVMMQSIHLPQPHLVYIRVRRGHCLRQSELKSGSASVVTFLAALLLLRCLCLASAKLWMQGTRTTFICAGHCEPWLLRLRALTGFVFPARLAYGEMRFKKELGRRFVLCAHMAFEQTSPLLQQTPGHEDKIHPDLMKSCTVNCGRQRKT